MPFARALPGAGIGPASVRESSGACETPWIDRQGLARSRFSRWARSRDGTPRSWARAERVAHDTDVLGIITSELLMSLLVAWSHRAVGSHQRELMPSQQGIKVHESSSQFCKRERLKSLSHWRLHKCHASDVPDMGTERQNTSGCADLRDG